MTSAGTRLRPLILPTSPGKRERWCRVGAAKPSLPGAGRGGKPRSSAAGRSAARAAPGAGRGLGGHLAEPLSRHVRRRGQNLAESAPALFTSAPLLVLCYGARSGRNRGITAMTFKKSISVIGAAGLVLSLAAGEAAARDLTIVSFGGSYQDAQKKIYFEPYAEKLGKPVLDESWDG